MVKQFSYSRMLHYLGDDHSDQYSDLSLDLRHCVVPHAVPRTQYEPTDISVDAYKSCVPIGKCWYMI